MTTDLPPGPAARRRGRRYLGEMLLAQGVLTPDVLEQVLAQQKKEPGSRLGRLLVELGHCTETQICEAIGEQLQIPAADLAAVDVPPEVLAKVSRELAVKHLCLPWFIQDRDLFLIMADPTNVAAADAISFHTGLRVRPVVAPESDVLGALERFYAAEEASLAQFGNLDLAEQLAVVSDEEALAPADEGDRHGDDGPVVKLVNAILADAIQAGASDVHLEPQEKTVNLRYRVDGLLRQVMTLQRRAHPRLISRIKVMSHMDIAERRRPQDGRTLVRVGGRGFDVRVSTLPTADGEKCVMRILAQDRRDSTMTDLGCSPETLATLKEMLARPQGIILVTGPTGSGKTTTLYTALNSLRSDSTNIVTVEDPVEYRLAGINQVAVSDAAGLTFAAGLRAILRQDPDVVMVGEVRDLETAQTAFQAAQTGHLVLTTLHTNDAVSAITRLIDLGLPAYIVASSLLGVVAQRLVRQLCVCKKPQPDGTAVPGGCEACRFSGFKGRLGAYEVLRITPRVRSVVLAGGSEDLIRRAGRAAGMTSMFADGLAKVAAGATTEAELRRVVAPDEVEEEGEDGAPSRQPALPPGLSADARTDRPTRVLVVDDDPMLREILKETLASDHHEVLLAATGEEALAQVYQARPDLVVTDVQMPGMDGFELVRRIRSDLSTVHIPVIFLSVVDTPDSEMKALDLGADDYLAKPVSSARLLGRVRRALQRARVLRGAG